MNSAGTILLIACGGDGTAHRVVEELLNTGVRNVVVGAFPLGKRSRRARSVWHLHRLKWGAGRYFFDSVLESLGNTYAFGKDLLSFKL